MDDWFDTIHSDDDDDDEIEVLSELTLAQRMRRRIEKQVEGKPRRRIEKKEEETPKVKRKRERVMWSESEIESLKAGVERYGAYKNCWSKILEDDDFEFESCRNGVDLKDKYRNLGLPERVVSGGWLKGLIRGDKKKKKKKRPRLIIVDDPITVSSPSSHPQTQNTQLVDDDEEEDYEDYSEIPKIPPPKKKAQKKKKPSSNYQQTQLTQPVEVDVEYVFNRIAFSCYS